MTEYLKLILLDECISLHFQCSFQMKALQLACQLIEEPAFPKRAFLQLPTLQLESCPQFNTSPVQKVGLFGLCCRESSFWQGRSLYSNLHDYPQARTELEYNKYLLVLWFNICVKELNHKHIPSLLNDVGWQHLIKKTIGLLLNFLLRFITQHFVPDCIAF